MLELATILGVVWAVAWAADKDDSEIPQYAESGNICARIVLIDLRCIDARVLGYTKRTNRIGIMHRDKEEEEQTQIVEELDPRLIKEIEYYYEASS